MAETMNMKSINIEKFIQLIKEQLEDGDLTPIIGIGKSGIGKTVGICELAKKMGIGYCELRLVTLTQTDMLGLPMVEGGRTTYASNELLPDEQRDGEIGILVLDEITSAERNTRAAAFQLLDSKRALGNYKLPPKWLVVCLGNGESDGGVFNGMELAFLNRCRCWRVEPALTDWKHWATENGVNEAVTGFVSFQPEMLHKFDPDEPASVFPSPRSWEALSKKLNSRENKKGSKLDGESVELYASGCVGQECGVRFAAFYEYNKKIINAEDVLAGTASTDLGNVEPEVKYMLVASITKLLSSRCITAGFTGRECVTRGSDVAQMIGNTFAWIYNVSRNTSLDLAATAIMDITENIPCIESTILSDWYTDDYPEFDKYSSEQSNVY